MSTFSLTLKFTQEFTGFVVYFINYSTTPGGGQDRGRLDNLQEKPKIAQGGKNSAQAKFG